MQAPDHLPFPFVFDVVEKGKICWAIKLVQKEIIYLGVDLESTDL